MNLLKSRSLSCIDYEGVSTVTQLLGSRTGYLIVSRSVVLQVAAVLAGVAPVSQWAGGPRPAVPPGGAGGRHLPLLGLGGRSLSTGGSLTIPPGYVASRHHLRYYNYTRPTHILATTQKCPELPETFLHRGPNVVWDTDCNCYVLLCLFFKTPRRVPSIIPWSQSLTVLAI